jgi:hypothetical protein
MEGHEHWTWKEAVGHFLMGVGFGVLLVFISLHSLGAFTSNANDLPFVLEKQPVQNFMAEY